MAKAIVSYPKSEQENVIARRLENETGGLGYLSAVDAQKASVRAALVAKGLIKPVEKEAEAS